MQKAGDDPECVDCTKPRLVTDRHVWKHAKEAHKLASAMVEGKDYVYDGQANRFYKREEKSIKKNKTPRWLDYLNYRAGHEGNQDYKDVVYTQAIPHMCGAYDRLFGLTGTVGGPPERRYLREEYKCELVTVPPFLSTCVGFNDTNQRTRKHCSMESGQDRQFRKNHRSRNRETEDGASLNNLSDSRTGAPAQEVLREETPGRVSGR